MCAYFSTLILHDFLTCHYHNGLEEDERNSTNDSVISRRSK
jgi:hypothetical protein